MLDDQEVRYRNSEAKEKRKLYAGEKREAPESEVKEGDRVLLKHEKTNTLKTTFRPEPFPALEKLKIYMYVVAYHLVGKTGWSKVAVNGTHQNHEWTFPWEVRVPFPRTSPRGRKGLELVEKGNGTHIFLSDIPVGNFGLHLKTFRLIYFRNFPVGQTKIAFPFTFQLKFSDFFGKW